LRTIVYVDGYNLYYGLLRSTPYKWLDLLALFQNEILENAEVLEIRFYTAPVLGRMCDDPKSPQHQRTYMQALRKTASDRIAIIEGRMVSTTPIRRLASPLPDAPHIDKVQVVAFTEKKTDVNLATDILIDAWTRDHEQVVICCNDSDIEAALAGLRNHRPHLRIGLVAPVRNNDRRWISKDLEKLAHWSKSINETQLQAAQLPDRIPGTSIEKPQKWRIAPY
jgi:hypothetical protein